MSCLRSSVKRAPRAVVPKPKRMPEAKRLALAAFLGLVYTIAAWQAGKFAQRCGYFTALKIGFAVMAVSFAAGFIFHTALEQILIAATQ